MFRSFLVSITVAALLSLTSCAVNPVSGKKQLMFVSEESEVEMGRELYPSAIWAAEGGGGDFRDEELTEYLKGVVVDIHKVSHRPNLPVDFVVQNSSVPNAWAIPGHVVITRGLLAGLESEAEFAFVMGHEMGHVSARHSASRMTYGMLQQVGLIAVAVGMGVGGMGDYTGAAIKAGAIGSSLIILKYSRADELEADRLGIEYMAKLGYDPRSSISAHRNLEKVADEYMASLGKENGARGFFENLLSTHPRASVRIDELDEMRRSLPPHRVKGDGTGAERFKTKTKLLREKNKTYRAHYDKAVLAFQKDELHAAEEHVDAALSKDANEPPFHVLKGFLLLEKDDLSSAEIAFKRALDLEPGYEPAMRGFGALHYHRGEYAESIDTLKGALDIYPDDLAAYYYLGMSHYQRDDYGEALKHLKPFASAAPKEEEIHTILGSIYEFNGEFRAAYASYLNQLKVAPRNEAAHFARWRAGVIAEQLERSKGGPIYGVRAEKYKPMPMNDKGRRKEKRR